MSVTQPDKDRRLLPRWQASNQSIAAGELSTIEPAQVTEFDTTHFEERRREWERVRSLEVAAELVGSALVLGRTNEVQPAARLLADSRSDVSPALHEMALHALGAAPTNRAAGAIVISSGSARDKAKVYNGVSRLRRQLNEYPRNPLSWVDLGRLYTILGEGRKAQRALTIALELAPEDRFVLRSAARFFVHIDRPDKALSLLQRSRLTRSDPWLMAPEIAIASIAERHSKMLSIARNELKRRSWSPRNRSELQGALGTVFLEGGSSTQARQMFRGSLEDPTENAIAQAQWAAERAQIEVPEEFLNLPSAHEARALRYRTRGKWAEVIENCWEWASYEPTSSRSMLLGSYAASIAFEDGETIIRFSALGLDTEPRNPILLNNLAVGLAYAGDLDKAWETLRQVVIEQAPELAQPALYATTGLLFFRSGFVEQGRLFYEKAIGHVYSQRDPRIKALALWHLVREEARARTEKFAEALKRAERLSKDLKFPEVDAIRRRLPRT